MRVIDMKRKTGKANLLRRIEELEARTLDGSGLIPHSPEWQAFWHREVILCFAGKPHVPPPLEAVRDYIQNSPPDGCEEEIINASL